MEWWQTRIRNLNTTRKQVFVYFHGVNVRLDEQFVGQYDAESTKGFVDELNLTIGELQKQFCDMVPIDFPAESYTYG
ncbi:hypothetical protein CH63R_08270 [Colletotrichum higginsianum IMI 349063]|uniref:Uncharacterized protein n=1 Tax=Colletotrichum higginsianum (strain IMI 349063) TaxID=759273 RepID=A0A1B7YC19_COLHI|nr:hypothetical protein CH63R_08270 [Colletotrichum higginsianum IMI 349063]OBR09505.1 hypothetical protein CH63R_08270 [Colletotrichum higginsianum IMI 349063]GJC96419.1 hypothetical protein ColKHC_05245 [Colletotrichum higginsianum]